MVGETTYDKLSEQHEFYLPVDHEDPKVLLKYFEGEEEYEKCQIIKLKNMCPLCLGGICEYCQD
tara:strand:- start:987 stop:1178 length:192 start_codon:yes stop_codon:yes gene_type:complete